MIGLNHVLAGTFLAVITPVEHLPYLPLIALASHFILDAVPHYGNDETALVGSHKFRRILQIDASLCVLAVSFALYLYPDKYLWILIGAFFAAAPDILWLFEHRAKRRIARLYFALAKKIQWAEHPWAWSLEILWGMILITLLIGFS